MGNKNYITLIDQEEFDMIDRNYMIEIEEVINKPNYNRLDIAQPKISVESYKGKIINQQIIVATFYDECQSNFIALPARTYIYFFNGRRIKKHNMTIIKYNFLKESIMFDIHIRKSKLRSNKELINKYKEYNEQLLEEIDKGHCISKSLYNILDDETYDQFMSKTVMKIKNLKY